MEAAQVGRFFDGGAVNVGLATSIDGGVTWRNGLLPGITKAAGGPADRVSDASVAYDAAHNVWLVSSLPLVSTPSVHATGVVTSRSTDGGLTWGNPVTTSTNTGADKNWIACDNTVTSPFYGHCYTQFDDSSQGNRIKMSTSTDGGLIWGPARNTANSAGGIGGQPVVDPKTAGASAHLALTFYFYPGASCSAATCALSVGVTSSPNGGTSWTRATQIAGPMTLAQIANTSQGPMVGDYISTSYSGGRSHGFFAVGRPPGGTAFDEAIYTTAAGLVDASVGALVSGPGTVPFPVPHPTMRRRLVR